MSEPKKNATIRTERCLPISVQITILIVKVHSPEMVETAYGDFLKQVNV